MEIRTCAALTCALAFAPAADAAATTYGDQYWGSQRNIPKGYGISSEATANLATSHARVLAIEVPIRIRCAGARTVYYPATVRIEEERKTLLVRGGRFSYKRVSRNFEGRDPIYYRLAGRLAAGGTQIVGWASFDDASRGCHGRQSFKLRRWAPARWTGRMASGEAISFQVDRPGAGRSMTNGPAYEGVTTWLRDLQLPAVTLTCADGSTRSRAAASVELYAILNEHTALTRPLRGSPILGWKGPLRDAVAQVAATGAMRPSSLTGSLVLSEVVQPPPVVRTETDEWGETTSWSETPEPITCTSSKLAFSARPWE